LRQIALGPAGVPVAQRLDGLFDSLFLTNNEFTGGVTYTLALSEAIASNGFIAVNAGFVASFIAVRSTITGNWAIPDDNTVALRDESPTRQAAGNTVTVI
jgi:hypothetical protein